MTEAQGDTLIHLLEALLYAAGFLVIYSGRIALILAAILGSNMLRLLVLGKNQSKFWLVACVLSVSAVSPALADEEEWLIDETDASFSYGGTTQAYPGYATDYLENIRFLKSVGAYGRWDLRSKGEGTFRVYAHWYGPNLYCSSNVWMTFYNGDYEYVSATNVSQTSMSAADETREGFQWQYIGEIECDEGGFYFEIMDNSSGTYMGAPDGAVCDGILVIQEEVVVECEGMVWPGHPDYVGGKPDEWADSFESEAQDGNTIEELNGAHNTWTYSGTAGFDITGTDQAGQDYYWYEAGGGYIADNGYQLFLIRKDVGSGAIPYDYRWVVGKEGEEVFWNDADPCNQFGGSTCPTYAPCCTFGYFVSAFDIESEVCNVDGGDDEGGEGCCCGAQTVILEAIRDALEEEHEEPGETFSGTTPSAPTDPFDGVFPTHTLPDISEQFKTWQIPFMIPGSGESTFAISTEFAEEFAWVQALHDYIPVVRLALLWFLQFLYYKYLLNMFMGL